MGDGIFVSRQGWSGEAQGVREGVPCAGDAVADLGGEDRAGDVAESAFRPLEDTTRTAWAPLDADEVGGAGREAVEVGGGQGAISFRWGFVPRNHQTLVRVECHQGE